MALHPLPTADRDVKWGRFLWHATRNAVDGRDLNPQRNYIDYSDINKLS